MATFNSNTHEGRKLRLEVWQEGNDLVWQLFSEGGATNYYTIYNLNIAINGTNVYNPGTVGWSTQKFPAAKGNTSGRIYIGPSASGRNISVSFVGEVFYDRWNDRGGSVYMAPTIYNPYLSNISYGSITDTSVYGSFYVTDARGQNPYSPYIDVGETNFGSVVKTIAARAGTLSGLTPNKTYYIRGNDANDGGRSYTNVGSFKTLFYNPGAPGKPSIAYDKNEPIPTALYTVTWSKASNGSTAIAGYRFRIFKNGVAIDTIDTESTTTSKTIDLTAYDFQPGDILRIGIYAYCKDWQGTKFFNGGGSGEAQVYSDYLTIVSDKYIWISVAGAAFDKKKMHISFAGSAFVEVKKEKFKVI